MTETTAQPTIDERRQALLAACPDSVLIDTVRALDGPNDGSSFGTPERQAFVWAAEELEARHPEVVPALDAWAELKDDRTYGQVLLAALGVDA